MAKISKKKKNKKMAEEISQLSQEKLLPQNILPVGERVEENKNIYILQKTYNEIHKFTKNKTTNESGGVLVGETIEEFGKTHIIISGFIEAKHCEATPTTLKFTHETWEYIHKEIDKKFPQKQILGWIHTHPDFGIFLSEYDKFIHTNFFKEDTQIAYVIDPIQNIEGFYFWINGNLEKCNGFFIYDKAGAKINPIAEEIPREDTDVDTEKGRVANNIILAILSLAVVCLIFTNINLNNKIENLKSQTAKQQEETEQRLKDYDVLLELLRQGVVIPVGMSDSIPGIRDIPFNSEGAPESGSHQTEPAPPVHSESVQTPPVSNPTTESSDVSTSTSEQMQTPTPESETSEHPKQ